jgi:hypothetical protein
MRRSALPSTRRWLQAATAAAALATLLSGCTIEVTGPGGPAVRPVTAPLNSPVDATATATAAATADPADVYADWTARGWTPAPLLPVLDPASGASASLFGPAESSPLTDTLPDGAPLSGTQYKAMAAPGSVVTWFGVYAVPAGYTPDAEQAASATAASKNARIVDMQPVTVDGHPGVDVRLAASGTNGEPAVDLLRFVEIPGFLVTVESVGYQRDDEVIQQVQAIITDTMRLP